MEKKKPFDLPQVVVDFIDSVIKAMKYRKSVRSDVRQELTCHFIDALANCENEQHKQQMAQELIAGFGDIKLLGKLLRRAKKRCRPLWRTMVARTFQLIGICFLLLVLYIGWFFTGKPIITTNYVEIMNQQVRPLADENQNAWPFYKEAAEKRVEYEDQKEEEKFDFSPRRISTLSKQDRQIIQKSISDNLESLELIRQGNRKPYYWQVYDTGESETNEMMAVLMPHLSDYRDLSRLMCWQGLLSAEQGNFEKAFDELLEAYSFGQHLRGQKTTLIEQLVAMAIEGMSMDCMRIVLTAYDEQIDATLLNSVRERFEAMIADRDFTVDFDFEKLFMYDEIQRSFTQSRIGKSHLYIQRVGFWGFVMFGFDGDLELRELGLLFHILFTHPDKEQTLKEAERFYSKMQEMAALTPASIKSQGLGMEKFADEALKKNFLLGLLLPALEKVNQMSWRSCTETLATQVILSAMQYQKEYGQFPDSLDVLAEQGLLSEVPIDPYSDKPLVYRQTDDGFTLYSVGYNFMDDGGVPGEYKGINKNPQAKRWADNGDAVFWPIETVNSH